MSARRLQASQAVAFRPDVTTPCRVCGRAVGLLTVNEEPDLCLRDAAAIRGSGGGYARPKKRHAKASTESMGEAA